MHVKIRTSANFPSTTDGKLANIGSREFMKKCRKVYRFLPQIFGKFTYQYCVPVLWRYKNATNEQFRRRKTFVQQSGSVMYLSHELMRKRCKTRKFLYTMWRNVQISFLIECSVYLLQSLSILIFFFWTHWRIISAVADYTVSGRTFANHHIKLLIFDVFLLKYKTAKN